MNKLLFRMQLYIGENKISSNNLEIELYMIYFRINKIMFFIDLK
jgi:hypothetical protein